MKNKTTLIISLLIVGNLVLGFLFYHTHKRLDNFVEKVRSTSMLFSITSHELKLEIENLKKLKSDTVTKEYKNSVLQRLANNGTVSIMGMRLFFLVSSFRENTKNETELMKLEQAYCEQFGKLSDLFYYTQRSDFKNISQGDIDSLISYYRNLKTITESVEKIKIEP